MIVPNKTMDYNDDAPWIDTTYDGFMTHEEMLEEAAQREAAKHSSHYYDYDRNGKLNQVKIDNDSFGQKPWDEFMLAPNGDSIEAFPHVTRVEVIGKNGREFVQWDCSNVKISIQDDERTMKVFLS